jgi:hypothetical protein
MSLTVLVIAVAVVTWWGLSVEWRARRGNRDEPAREETQA